MKNNKKLFIFALIVVLLTTLLFFLKDFNLKWVEVSEDRAKIIINFLIPMDKSQFKDHVKVKGSKELEKSFIGQIHWTSPQTCEIELEEQGSIKGERVDLLIQNAPTMYGTIKKNAVIPIQFKSPIEIVSPQNELLISTDKSFRVSFNTPMKKEEISRYLTSDTKFTIESVENDSTSFDFTPKEKLKNDHKYILCFKKGMSSQSGVLLDKNKEVTLITDREPLIGDIAPADGNKWVGLYPRFTLTSLTPMKAAYLELDQEVITGTLKDPYHAVFYPEYVLGANRTYTATFQIQAHSGELSRKTPIQFKTLPLTEDRYWAEIILSKNQEMIIYKGTKEVRRIKCSGGTTKNPTAIGTFYVISKGDKYYDEESNEGANYWVNLTENIRIHGITRNAHWKMQMPVLKRLGEPQTKGDIVMTEDDALWLYQNLPTETMVIIHK